MSHCSQPEINNSIKMEVGIEDCLHIEFEYNRSKYHLKDVVIGKIYFLLVRALSRLYLGKTGTCRDLTWALDELKQPHPCAVPLPLVCCARIYSHTHTHTLTQIHTHTHTHTHWIGTGSTEDQAHGNRNPKARVNRSETSLLSFGFRVQGARFGVLGFGVRG
jgi:hypothetical protein